MKAQMEFWVHSFKDENWMCINWEVKTPSGYVGYMQASYFYPITPYEENE